MEFESNSYSLIIPEYVQNQLRTIKNYIETMYFSKQAGINTVNNILHGLERLTIFPEAGFNADEKVGKIIYPPIQNSLYRFRRLFSLLSYLRR